MSADLIEPHSQVAQSQVSCFSQLPMPDIDAEQTNRISWAACHAAPFLSSLPPSQCNGAFPAEGEERHEHHGTLYRALCIWHVAMVDCRA